MVNDIRLNVRMPLKSQIKSRTIKRDSLYDQIYEFSNDRDKGNSPKRTLSGDLMSGMQANNSEDD